MPDNPQSSDFDPAHTVRLWEKYEEITMHFNDLLMQLRSRSLVAIAGVATIVGVFADGASGGQSANWVVATLLFASLCVTWVAIFALDRFYYNKLLNGSVRALVQLEDDYNNKRPAVLNLSTQIQKAFTRGEKGESTAGVLSFYGFIFVLLFACAMYSAVGLLRADDQPTPSTIESTIKPPVKATE